MTQGTQLAWKPIHTAPHKGIFLVTDGTQVGLAKATSDGMVVKLFDSRGQELTGWTEAPSPNTNEDRG